MRPFKPTRALQGKPLGKEQRGSRGGRWTKVSAAYRKSRPICEVCNERVSTCCHHLKPWHHYPALRYVYSNLQALCKACHDGMHVDGTQH